MTEVQAIQLIGGSIIVLACANMILLTIILRGVIWQLKLTEKSLAMCVSTTKVLLDILSKADKWASKRKLNDDDRPGAGS